MDPLPVIYMDDPYRGSCNQRGKIWFWHVLREHAKTKPESVEFIINCLLKSKQNKTITELIIYELYPD